MSNATHLDRDAAISRIRAALKSRSTQRWSVTGGSGTAWGWITVRAPPARRGEYGYTSDSDRVELAAMFGVPVHEQGLQIAPEERGWYVAAIKTLGERIAEAAESGWDAFFAGKGGDPHMDARFWELVEGLAAADRQRVHRAWVEWVDRRTGEGAAQCRGGVMMAPTFRVTRTCGTCHGTGLCFMDCDHGRRTVDVLVHELTQTEIAALLRSEVTPTERAALSRELTIRIEEAGLDVVRRAVDEHGRSNTFGPGELASIYGGPSAMLAGRIGRDIVLMGRLYEAIGGHAWGSAPRYAGGRFAI